MVILALECSTSAAKALVYDTAGRGECLRAVGFDAETADATTQDADLAYAELLSCGARAVAESGLSCDAVVLTSTWHSLLLCGKDGNPVGRIRMWSDLEGADYTARFSSDAERKRSFYERTGCVLHATYPIWKYRYLRENGKIPDGLQLYAQGEYLFRRLTGVRAVSRNIASGSGFLNLRTLRWDESLLKEAKIGESRLGTLCAEDHSEPLAAEAARALGLPQGIPVYAGGADGAMTQIGCGALADGIMTVSVGTSGALRISSAEPLLPEAGATWCYALTGGRYIAGAATNGAGNCVNRFVSQSGRKVKELDALLPGGDFSEAPLYLPFIFGERCPGWSRKPYGGSFGGEGGQAARYYAVLEGVLFSLRQCYEILAAAGGSPCEIRVPGGIVNGPEGRQLCADIFEREISASEMQHASLLGGVVLAAKANGEDLGARAAQAQKTVRPDGGKAVFYRTRYQKYLGLYARESKAVSE